MRVTVTNVTTCGIKPGSDVVKGSIIDRVEEINAGDDSGRIAKVSEDVIEGTAEDGEKVEDPGIVVDDEVSANVGVGSNDAEPPSTADGKGCFFPGITSSVKSGLP